MDGQNKYWGSLSALYDTPEHQAGEKREFTEPPGLNPPDGTTRREFLKLMGASLMMATVGCTRRPVEKIIPYVHQPEEITPGMAAWYASTCGGCSAACGIVAKVREGRPVKLEGNPEHPLSRGGLCARGQASLLDLYDPDRLQHPLKVARGAGSHTDTTWESADAAIVAQLKTMQSSGKNVAVLTGATSSSATRALIAKFVDTFPGAKHVAFEAVVPEEIAVAQEVSYGSRLVPHYRFDQAQYILSFGADFLGTWISPVEFAKDFRAARNVDAGKMARFVAFEGALSLTGTNADEYVALKPGDELAIAMALAHEIIVKSGKSSYAGDAAVKGALEKFSVEAVAASTGVAADVLRRIAKELMAARGQGLVVGGAPKVANAVALQVAVNLLNSALENDGVTIDWSAPSHQADSNFDQLTALIAAMRAGKIGALIIHGSDPLLTLPAALGFANALKNVDLVVSCVDRVTATAAASDFVCPDLHYLENWNDANPQQGVFSVAQPVIGALYNLRAFQDSLIVWGALPAKSWAEFLQQHWQDKIAPQVNGFSSFTALWQETLRHGVVVAGNRHTAAGRVAPAREVASAALSTLKVEMPVGELRLALYPSVAHYDGRAMNNGWLHELPDPVTKVTWENYISMAPKTALALGVNEWDVVNVRAGDQHAELTVHLQPKLHAGAAMVALGYGQSTAGHVGNGVGVNVFPLQTVGNHGLAWSGQSISIATTGKKNRLAPTQEHHTIMDRPIIMETTWDEFKKDPHAGTPESEELITMWPAHEYTGYRWGMAIDLTACTGCSACMIACQVENNVPIVGKEQVIVGRDMHWLRIDRYYSGDEANADVVHQPMLCQQCENAPCETVCPTLATYHDAEGLNMQTYNRCVGTRYCANNCPYKVRRFNYFDYSQQYRAPLNEVFNPDVTVRTKGVMEKCTFCVQRIIAGKDSAKDAKRSVRDGDIRTACQQSCPSDAIVFGDTNDPNSRVSKLRAAARGYKVLENLNAKPQITYLSKVRNKA